MYQPINTLIFNKLDNMIDFSKTLFLDIETVSHEKDYNQLSERMQKLWDHKAEQIAKGDENATPESLYERAAIYAEFGRIVCISVGFFNDQRFRLKSFYGHDEKTLLIEFANMLGRYYNTPDAQLCAQTARNSTSPTSPAA